MQGRALLAGNELGLGWIVSQRPDGTWAAAGRVEDRRKDPPRDVKVIELSETFPTRLEAETAGLHAAKDWLGATFPPGGNWTLDDL